MEKKYKLPYTGQEVEERLDKVSDQTQVFLGTEESLKSVSVLRIRKMSEEKYRALLLAGEIEEDTIYLTPEEEIDFSEYMKTEEAEVKLEQRVPNTRKVNGKTLENDIVLNAEDVGADESGTAESKVSAHNTSTGSHNDIRLLIDGLNTRLNAIADSDDETLDQMSEIVAYIKNNKDLIESVTTSKVNITDIIDNLTTNVSSKVLSAAQGVVLKGLIDELQSALNDVQNPTYEDATELATLTSGEKISVAFAKIKSAISTLITHIANKTNPHTVTAEQVGLGNVDNTSDKDKPISTATQNALDSKANKSDIATTAMLAQSNSSTVYVKISDFGAWGTGAWYQKGFSMLLTSRAGELVWVSLAANDSNTTARAFRLINTYTKINALYYSASESAIYCRMAAWCNNVCVHILTNVNGDYVPTVAQASALPEDAVEINIVEFGVSSSGTQVGDTSVDLLLGGAAERPTYNSNDVALYSDIEGLQDQITAITESAITVYTGSEEPTSDVGENGDLYLITE